MIRWVICTWLIIRIIEYNSFGLVTQMVRLFSVLQVKTEAMLLCWIKLRYWFLIINSIFMSPIGIIIVYKNSYAIDYEQQMFMRTKFLLWYSINEQKSCFYLFITSCTTTSYGESTTNTKKNNTSNKRTIIKSIVTKTNNPDNS